MSEQQEQSQGKLRKQRKPFVMSPTHLFTNPEISSIAKTLWQVLDSKPDGWVFYWSEIQKHFKEGRDAVRKSMKELEKFGYVQRKKAKKGNLLCGMDIDVFFDPTLPFDQENQGSARSTEFQYSEDQYSENQASESQLPEIRSTEDQDTKKEKSDQDLSNQYSSKKDLSISSRNSIQKIDESEIWFDEFWKNTYRKITDSKGVEGSKGSKTEARKQWDKLLKEGESPVHIIWGARAYLKKIEGRIQNCHAERFLRDRRYEEYIEDEIERKEKETEPQKISTKEEKQSLDNDPFWIKAKEDFQNEKIPEMWKKFIDQFSYYGIDEKGFHLLKPPSPFVRDWFEREYKEILLKIFGKFALLRP